MESECILKSPRDQPEVIFMITYAPLFATMKEKKISTYRLINYYNMSRGLIDRLKHDRPITTTTIPLLVQKILLNLAVVKKPNCIFAKTMKHTC